MSLQDLVRLGEIIENALGRISTALLFHGEHLHEELPRMCAAMDEALGVARLLQISGRDIGFNRDIPVPLIPVPFVNDEICTPVSSSRHSSPVPEQIQASIRLVTAWECALRPVTIARGRELIPVPFDLPVGRGRARTHHHVCPLPPSRQPRASADHPCLELAALPVYEHMPPRPMVPDTPPPPYEEVCEEHEIPSFDFSAAGIHRTILWPTTACAGTTSTYFASPLEDEESEIDE